MVAALLLCLLAAPGTIRVRIEGEAREVVAYRDGMAVARAPVADGQALVEGLEPGAYDLRAEGDRTASDVVPGVRAVEDAAGGFDAVLTTRRAHRVQVKTEPLARVWTSGLSFAPPLLLPEGMHRIVVDKRDFVSSAERWLRVAGPMEIDVPLEEGLAIAGTVTWKGAPLAQARVEVFADGLPTRRTATTDAHGNFAVTGFRGDVVSLRVTASGFAERLERIPFDPGSERARAEIEVHPGSAVRLDVDGSALLLPEWYEVALEEPRVHSNYVPARSANGRFDGLVPGRRYAIVAEARGFRPARTETFVAPPAGETKKLGKLTLEPGARIAGKVIGGGAGGVVVSQGPEGTLTCRADRQGRFEFMGLDPGEHILWVRDVDETGMPVALAPGETKSIELACSPPPPERALKGFVFDADRKPLPGVLVEAAGQSAVTDAEGAFRLDPLPRGPVRFTATFVPGPGCRALVDDPHLPFTERQAVAGAEVRVQLERAGKLSVRLDAGDRSLARATLLLASGSTGLKLRRRLPRHATEVTIDELPVGPYLVEVAAPGVVGTSGAIVQATPSPEAPSPVKVHPGRTVRGKVLLRRWLERPGAAPLAVDAPASRGFVALLDGDPLRAPCVAPLDPDGTFVLDGLPDGAALLAAAVPGLPVALAAADGLTVEIAVEQPAEAAVRVTGEDGPLPQARVQIMNDLGIDVRDLAANGRFRGVIAGDEDCDDAASCFRLERAPDGRIAALFLQPGSYRFAIAAEGYEPAQLGVRARTEKVRGRIREGLDEEDFPSGPLDLASPVRLSRTKG